MDSLSDCKAFHKKLVDELAKAMITFRDWQPNPAEADIDTALQRLSAPVLLMIFEQMQVQAELQIQLQNVRRDAHIASLKDRGVRNDMMDTMCAIMKESSPLLKHGKTFKEAGRLPRQDALGKILESIVKEHVSNHHQLPQYISVVHQLRGLANTHHQVIQEVDTEEKLILWRRDSGKEEQTTFNQLRGRLTPIRKKYSGATG